MYGECRMHVVLVSLLRCALPIEVVVALLRESVKCSGNTEYKL